MKSEYDIFDTLLSSDDLTPTNHGIIYYDILFVLMIIILFFALRKEVKDKKKKGETIISIRKHIVSRFIMEMLLILAMIGLNILVIHPYKEYNETYNGDLKFYQIAELKEGLPTTWGENKEEIYHKAVERFKNNPDDFNLETACEEHENDDKKPAACGGDLNNPLETTINGKDSTVTVKSDVYKDTNKDDKLSVKFVYKFNQ